MIGMIPPASHGGAPELPIPDAPKPDAAGSDDFASMLAMAWSAPNVEPAAAPRASAGAAGAIESVEPANQGEPQGPKNDALGLTTETPLIYSIPEAPTVTATSQTMGADSPITLDPLTEIPAPDRPPVDPFHVSASLMTHVIPTPPSPTPQVKNPKVDTPTAETPAAQVQLGTVFPETTPVQPTPLRPDRIGRRPADETRRAAAPDRETERRDDAPSPKNDDPKHVSHERVEVVSRPREARRPAPETHPVHALLSEARKPAAAINASSLKPLFEAKPVDAEATTEVAQVESVETRGGTVLHTTETVSAAQSASVSPQTASATIAQTADAVIGMDERIARHETRRLDIKLSPDDLGEIEVRLTRDADGKLSAMMLADRESTRHTLASGVDLLRGALERAGVAVDRLDVNVGAGGGNNAAAGSDGFGSQHERGRSNSGGDDYEMSRRPSGSANAADDDRLLSIRA